MNRRLKEEEVRISNLLALSRVVNRSCIARRNLAMLSRFCRMPQSLARCTQIMSCSIVPARVGSNSRWLTDPLMMSCDHSLRCGDHVSTLSMLMCGTGQDASHGSVRAKVGVGHAVGLGQKRRGKSGFVSRQLVRRGLCDTWVVFFYFRCLSVCALCRRMLLTERWWDSNAEF